MGKEPGWERRRLECPKDLCNDAKELLTFIQLPAYTDSFLQLELTDDEQREVENGIMLNLTLAEVIDGTGGIRRWDFSTPHTNPGSLHLSAYYAYFPETMTVALIELFQTDEIGEMTSDERAELKRLFEGIESVGPEAWEG